MNKTALRAAIASVAIAPMIALGAGVTSADPIVDGGVAPAPYDGIQSDSAGVANYSCVWVGRGVAVTTGNGPVTGLFLGPGVINGVCLNMTTPGIATGTGYVI